MPIDILTIIFKFVLFSLLVYKLMQLIKSYAIPLLKEELDLERKQQTELLEKEKLLVATQHRLENQINQQKKTFAFLDKNALLWQTHLLAKKAENEQLARCTLAQLEDKRKIQQRYLAIAKDSATIIPETFEQAKMELIKNFDCSEHGEQELHLFIAKLVALGHKIS